MSNDYWKTGSQTNPQNPIPVRGAPKDPIPVVADQAKLDHFKPATQAPGRSAEFFTIPAGPARCPNDPLTKAGKTKS